MLSSCLFSIHGNCCKIFLWESGNFLHLLPRSEEEPPQSSVLTTQGIGARQWSSPSCFNTALRWNLQFCWGTPKFSKRLVILCKANHIWQFSRSVTSRFPSLSALFVVVSLVEFLQKHISQHTSLSRFCNQQPSMSSSTICCCSVRLEETASWNSVLISALHDTFVHPMLRSSPICWIQDPTSWKKIWKNKREQNQQVCCKVYHSCCIARSL